MQPLILAHTSIITKRLILDRPTTALVDRFSFLEIWRSLSSLHVILNLIPTFMYGTWLFGLAYFLPTIVNELGFSTTHTQLVSVGPYAAGFVCERRFQPECQRKIANSFCRHTCELVRLRPLQATLAYSMRWRCHCHDWFCHIPVYELFFVACTCSNRRHARFEV